MPTVAKVGLNWKTSQNLNLEDVTMRITLRPSLACFRWAATLAMAHSSAGALATEHNINIGL
jgi:hypothetical protein